MSNFVLNFLTPLKDADKLEYGPAIIEFLLLIVLCSLAFMWFKRISKKQELKTKDLEERITRERAQNAQSKANS